MNDPNNAECFRCDKKCESYDEYMFSWKCLSDDEDTADFCDECLTYLMREYVKEEKSL